VVQIQTPFSCPLFQGAWTQCLDITKKPNWVVAQAVLQKKHTLHFVALVESHE
jgi:hypothetical protein